jgi:hypothetical protein
MYFGWSLSGDGTRHIINPRIIRNARACERNPACCPCSCSELEDRGIERALDARSRHEGGSNVVPQGGLDKSFALASASRDTFVPGRKPLVHSAAQGRWHRYRELRGNLAGQKMSRYVQRHAYRQNATRQVRSVPPAALQESERKTAIFGVVSGVPLSLFSCTALCC